MPLNANATPFNFSTECVIDMPHDVMLDYEFPYTLHADYEFPYTLQTDYIKNEVHPPLDLSYESLSMNTPYYSCVLTCQPNGLHVPIYYEVQPWSSILSLL